MSSTSTSTESFPLPRSYDELVVQSPQGSAFATSWWLEAAAPGRWRPNTVERQGVVVAAWPTVVRRSRWGDIHTGAALTPYLGPILSGGESIHRRRSREADQLEDLLAQLGRFAHVEARCNPAFDYWTPLHWHQFSQTTHYTWRLSDVSDTEAVFARLRENLRREVRKARKQGVVVEDGTLADYLRLHERGAERQDRLDEARSNRGAIERLEAAASGHGAGELLIARDGGGRLHSGGFYVHDARWTYYLLGASDPELRTSGAASLVMWTAIERAAARGTGFDFEGSMLRPVERFMRAWGGEPAPYSIVRKTASRGFAAERAAKRTLRRARVRSS